MLWQGSATASASPRGREGPESPGHAREQSHLSSEQTLLHQELLLAAPHQLPLEEFWSFKEEFWLSWAGRV